MYLLGWLLTGLGCGLLVVSLAAPQPFVGVLLMAALLLIIFGLASAAGYQVVARRSRPAGRFRGPSPLLLFGIQVALVNAVSLVLLGLGVDLQGTGPGFLVSAIVLFAGYLVVVWLFGVRTGAMDRVGLGLPARVNVGRLVSDVLGGGGLMLVVALVASLIGGIVARLIGTSAPEVVPLPTSGLDIVFVVVGACVLIPIGEEILFRGYSLTAWRRDLGERAALFRSTLFFALVHIITITSPTFLDGAKQAFLVVLVIAPVGYALGWLFVRRGLVAAIAGHAAFNLFGVLILVLAQNLPELPTT